MNITFVGEFFPVDDDIPFFCTWGSNDTLPGFQTIWPAQKISKIQVRCNDVPLYDSALLGDQTPIDVQLTYNI